MQLADPAAWTATVADPGRPEGAAEVAAYAGLVALGVRELTAADVVPAARSPMPSVPTVPTGPSASTVPTGRPPGNLTGRRAPRTRSGRGRCASGYVIPGFDRAPRWVSRTIRLARTGSGWRIARWLGPTDRREAFDLAPLAVVRSERALVAGPVALDVLRAHLDDVHTGQDRAAAVFGRLSRPSSSSRRRPTPSDPLGSSAPPGGQIAATTHGARDPRAPALADRVVLDPTGLARLTPAGRRVVLTHELTHVSVRASTLHDLPLWLSEGFAEWVAFRDEGMDPRVVAAALLDRVRAAGPPARLPADADCGDDGGPGGGIPGCVVGRRVDRGADRRPGRRA